MDWAVRAHLCIRVAADNGRTRGFTQVFLEYRPNEPPRRPGGDWPVNTPEFGASGAESGLDVPPTGGMARGLGGVSKKFGGVAQPLSR